MKFRYWLETYEDLVAQYKQVEPQIINNPNVQKELAQMGYVKISTIARALGVSEGEASFYARQFNKTHENPRQQAAYNQQQAEIDLRNRQDEFYYHVLPVSRLESVMKTGLKPNQPAVFSNYKNHSRGRIFLCEKEGVNFWKSRVEDHLFHNGDDEDETVVIRVRKDLVKVESDPIGTKDSGTPSYFAVTPIPPQALQRV